ncbi:hypothetical protein ACFYSJ_05205 [Streptomyces sp. NPDC005248]|uniref:hypothetical protein n=1 Tax=Streptomyces sp. NPDC005248 TaxID=3364709 RepID=UPI0036CA21D7
MYPHFHTPTERVIAYTAGLIDGEGSVCAQGNRYQINVTQSVVNDGEDLCRWFAKIWGLGTVYGFDKNMPNMQWAWHVAQARAVEHVLITCMPDLRVKRRQAVKALAWVQAHIAEGRRLAWTPGEERWLLDHWDAPDAELAASLGRSQHAIRHHRNAKRPDAPDRRGVANRRRVAKPPQS